MLILCSGRNCLQIWCFFPSLFCNLLPYPFLVSIKSPIKIFVPNGQYFCTYEGHFNKVLLLHNFYLCADITIFRLVPEHYMCAKFHFVDLAGSERAHRTGNIGDRLKGIEVTCGEICREFIFY